jgi:hypothetical protein
MFYVIIRKYFKEFLQISLKICFNTMNKILKRFRQEIELMYMMAKKEQTAWSPCRPCFLGLWLPVVRLPVARLPVARLPVARLPVVRLPVIWLPTSAKTAQNKLPMAFSFLVRCVQGIFHLKKKIFHHLTVIC